MTINLSDNSPRISYSVSQGVTQSTFTVPFEFFAEESLNVYVDNVLKTLTTHYTTTGGSGSTGTVFDLRRVCVVAGARDRRRAPRGDGDNFIASVRAAREARGRRARRGRGGEGDGGHHDSRRDVDG